MNRATRRKPARHRRVVRRKPAAIVHVQPPEPKPWQLGPDQLTILKNSICRGATDDELKFCLIVAERYKLDPFKRQIWFVPRWDSKADNGKGGKGAQVYTPQVGIDGLLYCASRDHRHDFGSISLPEFGPLQDVEWNDDGKMRKFKAPEWALVKAWKKGVAEPTEAQAYWDEYAPHDFTKAPFWRKMPRRMLAKCATALAIRQAYPNLGGIYIPEECERINEDFTNSGREIVVSGGTREAQQEVAQRRIEEMKAKIDARKKDSIPEEPKGVIELDFSLDESSPIVRGEIAALLETLKLHLHLTWGADNWWHCEPRDAHKLAEICYQFHHELREILPSEFPVAASKPAKAGPAQPGKSPTGETAHNPPSPAGGAEEAPKPAGNSAPQAATAPKSSGTSKTSSRKKERATELPRARIPSVVTAVKWTPSGKGLEVTLDTGMKLYCFDNMKMGEDGEKLLDVLVKEAVGKECVFETKKAKTKDNREFVQISKALRIGEREWDEDGVPILRRDPPTNLFDEREPGEE